jgi:cytochrome P450
MADTGRDYLEEFDRADEKDRYPLVQKWIRDEPLPFFKQLRKERPVLETPECTLVANFTDVRDMLQMPKIFTVDLYKPKMGVTGPDDGYLMAHDDDALHYREKSLIQGLLNRKDLPRVRKMVGETAARLLEEAGGRIEFVNDYCRMVPVYLVQDYFGLNGIDREKLIEWSY